MNKHRFQSLTVCLDMYGCPNRCKHCWIGHSPNGNLTKEDLINVAKFFRPYTDSLTIYDWYREPDYHDNYKELWDLSHQLSDTSQEHFELISVYRIVRDKEYVKWLSSLGLKSAQLTLFGTEEKTDFYTGRKHAYLDILNAIEILLDHHISPRIQVFVNKDNLDNLSQLEKVLNGLDLEKRCQSFKGEYAFFIHQGSCDGENEKNYAIRLTPNDIKKIPQKFLSDAMRYQRKKSVEELFGKTEAVLYDELKNDTSTCSFVSDNPVFYIDQNLNVYPNVASIEPIWKLGNLKKDGIEKVLENYRESKSVAQNIRLNIPLSKIVQEEGNPMGEKLFEKEDYIEWISNRYCRKFLL